MAAVVPRLWPQTLSIGIPPHPVVPILLRVDPPCLGVSTTRRRRIIATDVLGRSFLLQPSGKSPSPDGVSSSLASPASLVVGNFCTSSCTNGNLLILRVATQNPQDVRHIVLVLRLLQDSFQLSYLFIELFLPQRGRGHARHGRVWDRSLLELNPKSTAAATTASTTVATTATCDYDCD